MATETEPPITHRIGIISDTHGLLRPEALAALQGCELIIHAGDVGKPEVLQKLNELAPMTTVRGNNDKGAWAEALPVNASVMIQQVGVYLIHDLADLAIDPVAAGVRVVISGHSHKPSLQERGGVLYLNPGSAGPRRFKLPVTIAELTVQGGEIAARIIHLPIDSQLTHAADDLIYP
ncbi:metallophosphoesterase family protein [Methylomonas sp. 2BW1-5-20]|uniref:metallophosphoesterase family protein n=1 Tax=Methylomonas sp. 2BW1-5-20 TaxID=3376686 RepID=UPI00404DCB5E